MLAFDPPVRRQRREYLVGAMQLDVNDGETYLLAVTHRTQTWARNTDYERQKYALAVTIADEARTDINLFALVAERIELPARVRVRH